VTAPVLVVTGASGFVGRHLAAIASGAGYRVWAIGREDTAPAELAGVERYVGADLAAGWPITETVDAIVHLAGLAAVGPSFREPQRYLEVNSAMMTALGESLLAQEARTRVVVVSSGAVYSSNSGEPIDERVDTIPNSPYAVAKLLVETQTRYYRHRGLDAVVARPFNHIGPGQSRGFLVPDLTAALRDAPEGTPLTVGNLDTARDYTDVRDVARAYLALIEAPTLRRFVYNVASGDSRTGREVLAVIADALGRGIPPLVVDPARLRPGDPPRVVASAAALREELGWEPTVDWRTSVREYIATSA
jgi:GDP-4-dehydro-6-deoxy-D-mannose reductase